jgi:hypothetical protein
MVGSAAPQRDNDGLRAQPATDSQARPALAGPARERHEQVRSIMLTAVVISVRSHIGLPDRRRPMSTNTSVAVVLVDESMRPEAIAVAGLLAGYCGGTRRSYATGAGVRSTAMPPTSWRRSWPVPLADRHGPGVTGRR